MIFKKGLYKGVIVPTSLYGADPWDKRSADRRKVSVLEVKWLRSSVEESRMDRVWDDEVRRRAGIERKLARRVDQRVLISRCRWMTVEAARQCAKDIREWRAQCKYRCIEFLAAHFTWFLCSFGSHPGCLLTFYLERGRMPLHMMRLG